MVNAHEALACLGYPSDHTCRVATKEALRKLLVIGKESAYCQPCVSPVWDTALACLALQEEAGEVAKERVHRALQWLRERQLEDQPGDWQENHPSLKGGGWPFQFCNPYYPDLDDTAAVAWAMHQSQQERFRESVQRAADWIRGMLDGYRAGGFGGSTPGRPLPHTHPAGQRLMGR
jgi:squalene-hopene/tetraprenyl-beta-curcumene cyclase